MLHRSTSHRLTYAAITLALVVVGLVGPTSTGEAAPAHTNASLAPPYYLSLGDSYATGYQPTVGGSTKGYTAVVAKAQHLSLVNFGCGGVTTTMILTYVGCLPGAQPAFSDGWNSGNITNTQEANALAFIDAHPGQVKLVTVTIGGNDVVSCSWVSFATLWNCIVTTTSTMATNVGQLVSDLDAHLTAAGDTGALIVGSTYPDTYLAYGLNPNTTYLGFLSTDGFNYHINSTLNTAYTSVSRGRFVDVTNAPYVHGKLAATAGMNTNPYAVDSSLNYYWTGPKYLDARYMWITMAQEEICQLTFACSQSDPHPTTKGYKFIGGLINAKIAAG